MVVLSDQEPQLNSTIEIRANMNLPKKNSKVKER